jgi:hypothetical protein
MKNGHMYIISSQIIIQTYQFKFILYNFSFYYIFIISISFNVKIIQYNIIFLEYINDILF